jgi:hypothetical protein
VRVVPFGRRIERDGTMKRERFRSGHLISPIALTMTAILSVVLCVVPGSAALAASTWSVIPSPSKGETSSLNSVSCVSPSHCVAVGSYESDNNQVARTLIESWNGKAWSVAPSLNVGSMSLLNATSCSSNWCMAIGDFGNTTSPTVKDFAEWWNASSLTPVAMPNPSNSFDLLGGLSCSSPMFCMAVGDYGKAQSNNLKTLVETWNGKTWSVVASPDARARGSFLHGVSCLGPTDCVAVGDDENDKTLIESWNGTEWSIAHSANIPDDSLSDVSCTSTTNCMAVGFFFKKGRVHPLSEFWNGTTWLIVATPGYRQTIVELGAVSCSGPKNCIAVGTDDDTLIESWNGSVWSIVPSPNKGDGGSLSDVSCSSVHDCVATGDFDTDTKGSGFGTHTLVESSY